MSSTKTCHCSCRHVCPQYWSQTVGLTECFVLSMLVVNWMCSSNKEVLPTERHSGMSNTICPGFLPSKGNIGSEKHLSSLQPIMPSVWNFKFRYVFVYKKKNVILIITKHVLYKECFPDELNYLFCFNVYVRTATALWYILSVLLERPGTVEWVVSCDYNSMDKTNNCVCCVVNLCETQCLYHVISQNIFIKTMLLM